MNKEDAGLELYKIQDIMTIKKVKHILGHLREGGRIRRHIMSNITQAQIYSRKTESVLQERSFYKELWSEEIN